MYNLVDVVEGINLDLLNQARKIVSVLLKRARKWYWYCSTRSRCFRSHEVETRKEKQSAVRVIAVEKSNIEADLMQIELPGSETEFCTDTNQKHGRHIQ